MRVPVVKIFSLFSCVLWSCSKYRLKLLMFLHVNINKYAFRQAGSLCFKRRKVFNCPDFPFYRSAQFVFLCVTFRHSCEETVKHFCPNSSENKVCSVWIREQVDNPPPTGNQTQEDSENLSAGLSSVSSNWYVVFADWSINRSVWVSAQTLSPVLLLSPRAWTTSRLRPLFRVLLTETHRNTPVSRQDRKLFFTQNKGWIKSTIICHLCSEGECSPV